MFANNLSYHKVKKVKVSLTSGSRLESCISDEAIPEVRGLPKATTRRQRSLGFELASRGHCANVLSAAHAFKVQTININEKYPQSIDEDWSRSNVQIILKQIR